MASTKTQTKTNRNQSSSKSRNGSGKSQNQKSSTGKKTKTLEDLLEDGLKDIYSAETQLVEALPELAKAAYSEDLQDAFTNHLNETKRQVERLEKVFSRLDIEKSDTKKCEAMEGLIEEANKVVEDFDDGSVRDSALIIAAQKVEHYEIAAYGSLCELCDVLGFNQIATILNRTLDEEKNADDTLSDIAQDVNDDAFESTEHEMQSQDSDYQTA